MKFDEVKDTKTLDEYLSLALGREDVKNRELEIQRLNIRKKLEKSLE